MTGGTDVTGAGIGGTDRGAARNAASPPAG